MALAIIIYYMVCYFNSTSVAKKKKKKKVHECILLKVNAKSIMTHLLS